MTRLLLFACCAIASAQHFVYPARPSVTSTSNFLLDASGEKFGCIVTASKAGNLSRIRTLLSTVTTGGDLRVSFQDVDTATGNPDGTADQYRVISVADTDDGVVKYSGIISADGTDGGAKRTVAMGDRFAIVLDVDSYVAQNMLIRAGSVGSPTDQNWLGQNYCLHYTSGAWTKQTSAYPFFALEYDDGSYDHNTTLAFHQSQTVLAFASNNATQDEVALRFTVPVTSKTRACYFSVDFDAAATVRLYDGTTVIATANAGDSDIRPGTSDLMTLFPFTSEITLSPGIMYRLAIEATTTTAISVRYIDQPAVAVWDQFDGGQAVHWDARVDAGSWTPTTTRRPVAGCILYGITGGGGGSTGFAISQ